MCADLPMAVEQRSDIPRCDLCGDEVHAVVEGVLVVNARLYLHSPLCSGCYVPAEDLAVPRDTPASVLGDFDPTLVVRPDDEVVAGDDDLVVRHGDQTSQFRTGA